MAQESLKARAKHLTESARLLALTSPAISRHLRSELHSISLDLNMELSEPQKREACVACGNLMIPGWTSRTYLEKNQSSKITKREVVRRGRKAALPPPSTKEDAAEKSICHECLICNRKTRQPVQSRAKALIKLQRQTMSSRMPPPVFDNPAQATGFPKEASPSSPTTSSINANSKRRAKARKQSGLQALLAKKKEAGGSGTSGFGLDLMDFMKSG